VSPRALLLALLPLLPLAAGPAAAQAAQVLRGRLVHVDGLPTGNLTLNVLGHGAATTRGNGQFETAIARGAAEVTVEVVGQGWVVLYPRGGRVAVPRDPAVMVEIVVGQSVEAAALRLFAERHERMEAGLNAVGAGQEEIQSILTAFMREVTERLDVDAGALEREVALQQKRVEHFPTLSATVKQYLTEARDLTTAFELYSRAGFTDSIAYRGLHDAVQRLAFEQQVATFWESQELRSDVRALYDFALGDVHAMRILPLNESLAVMHGALWGPRPDRRRLQEAQQRIEGAVRELNVALPELERRADRVLQFLLRG
jgi:hypothetical protein